MQVKLSNTIEQERIEDDFGRKVMEPADHSQGGVTGEPAASTLHELRQPLAAIRLRAEACMATVESQRDHAPLILDDLREIISLTERAGDILHLGRRSVRKVPASNEGAHRGSGGPLIHSSKGMVCQGIVFVVDDDEEVRDSLVRLISGEGFPVRAHASAEQFLESYVATVPACIVLDIRMPGMSGIELQTTLACLGRSPLIIFMTGQGAVATAVEAVQKGAFDFVEKPVNGQLLLERIQQALLVDADRCLAQAHHDAAARRFAHLTPREREVVDLLLQGRSTKQIAGQLGVTPQAIDAHRSRALHKVGAQGLVELLRLALAAGQAPAALSA